MLGWRGGEEPGDETIFMSLKTYAPVKHTTYLECIDQIPPAYCRLVAREKHGGCPRLLTIPEIAQAAGLTWQKTAAIARRKSFATVSVEDADKFRRGCGITIQNEKRHMEFLARNFRREKGFNAYFETAKKSYGPCGKGSFIERILKRL